MFCQSSLFKGFGTVWSGRDIAKGAASLSFLLLLQNNLKNATKRERTLLSQEFQVIVHHTEKVHSSRSLKEVAWSCPNLKKSLGSAHFLYSYNSGFLAQVMMPPTGGRSYHLVLGFFFFFFNFTQACDIWKECLSWENPSIILAYGQHFGDISWLMINIRGVITLRIVTHLVLGCMKKQDKLSMEHKSEQYKQYIPSWIHFHFLSQGSCLEFLPWLFFMLIIYKMKETLSSSSYHCSLCLSQEEKKTYFN